MTTLQTDRTLTFDGVYNVRHLGGHRTAAGTPTNGHDVVRSGSLARLTPEGYSALRESGVRTILDLRSSKERTEHPSPDLWRHGIHVVGVPVFEHDASPTGLAEQVFPGYGPIYLQFLESGAGAYRTLLELLANRDGGFLFHCAVGKDRTGVAAALLLDLAGVDSDSIVEDYALSGANLQHLLAGFAESWRDRGIDEERGRALLGSPPEAMAATLAHVREQWGGAQGYFEHIGAPRTAIEDARARLLA